MKKIIVISLLFILCIAACGEKDPVMPPSIDDTDLTGTPYAPQSFTLKIPANFPQMEIPADNALTTEGVELGRRLFYDPILSRDSTMACASCHLSAGAFTDNKALSKGVDNINGLRSSMSLENVGFVNKGLFWDGHVKTLEEQALLPVEDPRELHTIWDKVVEKLKKHKEYPIRFRKAFGISTKNDITKSLAVKAISQFERTLISGNSKIDKIYRKEDFFTDDELDGFQLFFNASGAPDAQCGHCHTSPFFSSNDYFNNGLDSVKSLNDFKDLGRGIVTKKEFDNGKFRAPTLRNIELTAPYMHDGRFKTLEEVIEHYASGGHYADNVDPFIPQIATIKLTTKQKKQILLFLKTLTDTSFVSNPAFQNPFK
jgi:cytochrome c peroxidase